MARHRGANATRPKGRAGSIPALSAKNFAALRAHLDGRKAPFPLRPTAGHCTLNAEIVVRIHEGEPTRFVVPPRDARARRDRCVSHRRGSPMHAGVAQRQSSALIRRRSAVRIGPPAPAFAPSSRRNSFGAKAGATKTSLRKFCWPERLNVAQEATVRIRPQGPAFALRALRLSQPSVTGE